MAIRVQSRRQSPFLFGTIFLVTCVAGFLALSGSRDNSKRSTTKIHRQPETALASIDAVSTALEAAGDERAVRIQTISLAAGLGNGPRIEAVSTGENIEATPFGASDDEDGYEQRIALLKPGQINITYNLSGGTANCLMLATAEMPWHGRVSLRWAYGAVGSQPTEADWLTARQTRIEAMETCGRVAGGAGDKDSRFQVLVEMTLRPQPSPQ